MMVKFTIEEYISNLSYVGETCDMYWLGKRNYLLGDDIVMKDGWYIRDLCHPSNVGMYALQVPHSAQKKGKERTPGCYHKRLLLG